LERAIPVKRADPPPPTGPDLPVHDAIVLRLIELRSGVPGRVAGALRPDLPYDPLLAPQAIRLLAWNEVFDWARAFLLLHGHQAVGQVVEAVLEPKQDFAVRRRIPRILAYSNSQRAVDGLIAALEDTRFEIRYHASSALEFLHRMGEQLRFDEQAVMAAVERELSIPRPMWRGRKLLDKGDESDSKYWHLDDDVLKGRADKSLEHVFSLLALQLPAEPLKVSFRALHSEDRMLRGLALEYLEGSLSKEIVSQLMKLVEPGVIGTAPRAQAQVLNDLMASQVSILQSLRIPSADVG